MNFKKWVKSIQTAGYNGARTVCSCYCFKRTAVFIGKLLTILSQLTLKGISLLILKQCNITLGLFGPILLHYCAKSGQSYLSSHQSTAGHQPKAVLVVLTMHLDTSVCALHAVSFCYEFFFVYVVLFCGRLLQRPNK